MSRVLSFRDLMLIPALKGLRELDMLHPSKDALIVPLLYQLGFNANSPILYVPALHRDMQNKVGVGFRAVGEITQDRAYLTSKICPTIERLIAASHYDMSLTRELAKMMGNSTEWNSDYATDEDDCFPDELIEPDADEKGQEILNLEKLRDLIRGTPYNESGALKMPHEYQQN